MTMIQFMGCFSISKLMILGMVLRCHRCPFLLHHFRSESNDGKTQCDHDQNGDPVRRVPTDDSLFSHVYSVRPGRGPVTSRQ